MVPRAALEAAQDEVKRVEMEVERLRKGMEGMVFRAHLAAAQDEVPRDVQAGRVRI